LTITVDKLVDTTMQLQMPTLTANTISHSHKPMFVKEKKRLYTSICPSIHTNNFEIHLLITNPTKNVQVCTDIKQ